MGLERYEKRSIDMKIRDILKDNSPHVSFEVFPPKTDAGYEGVRAATEKIAALRPSFISVTYGAGGGTSRNTVRIASQIKNDLGVTSLAHLTCVSSTKDEVHGVIGQLKEQGIENILALRGDIPADGEFPLPNHYRYACELVEDIKSQGDFCIGAACYPEGHVEAAHKKDDIMNLKHKVDCGVDFLTTQMFFDNEKYYAFVDRCRAEGITVPIIPGIKPIVFKNQLTVLPKIFRSDIPEPFATELRKCKTDDEAKAVGVEWCIQQCKDLIAHGVPSLHFYTMMASDSVYKVAKEVY